MSTFTSLISRLHLAETEFCHDPMPYFMAGKRIQTSRLNAVLTVRDQNSSFYLEAPFVKNYEELIPFPDFCKSAIADYIPCYEKIAFALKAQGLWSGKTSYGIMKLMWIPLDLEEHVNVPFLLMFDHKVYHFGNGEPQVCIRVIRNNIEIVRGNHYFYYNHLLRPAQDIHGCSLDDEIWEICKTFPDMSNRKVEELLDYTPYTKYDKSVRKRRAYFALLNHLMKKPHNICATNKEKREMIASLKRLPRVGVTTEDKFTFSPPLEVKYSGKKTYVNVYKEVDVLTCIEKEVEVPSSVKIKKQVDDIVITPLGETEPKVFSNSDSLPRNSLCEVYNSWGYLRSGFMNSWLVSGRTFNTRSFKDKDSRGVWLFRDKQTATDFIEANSPWLAYNVVKFDEKHYHFTDTAIDHKKNCEHMGLLRYICYHYPRKGVPPEDFWAQLRENLEKKYPGFTSTEGHYVEELDYSKMVKKVETSFEMVKTKFFKCHEEVWDPNQGTVVGVKPNPAWPKELVKLSYKPGFSIIRSEYFPYKKINENHKYKLESVFEKHKKRSSITNARKKICEERQEKMKSLKVLEDKAIDEMIEKNAAMMFENPDILLPANSDKLLKSLRAGGFSWRSAKRLRVAVIAMINSKDAYSVLEQVVHKKYRTIVWHRKYRIQQMMEDY